MAVHRTAIVTGAGSGIGRAAAILLAEAGYNVVLVGRTKGKLEETAEAISAGGRGSRRAEKDQDRAKTGSAGASPFHRTGIEVELLAADICDPLTCRQVVEKTVARFGRIDALANVAGHAQVATIDQITPEEWRKTIDTNVSAPMYLTSAAWPVFARQKSGVVVNVSSMASLDPFPGFCMYAPSKAALNMFTLVTAREGEKIGVKAVCLAPGAVETPMLRRFFPEAKLPRHRTHAPEKIAEVIRDCITGARKFKPGETIELPSP